MGPMIDDLEMKKRDAVLRCLDSRELPRLTKGRGIFTMLDPEYRSSLVFLPLQREEFHPLPKSFLNWIGIPDLWPDARYSLQIAHLSYAESGDGKYRNSSRWDSPALLT